MVVEVAVPIVPKPPVEVQPVQISVLSVQSVFIPVHVPEPADAEIPLVRGKISNLAAFVDPIKVPSGRL